MKKYVNNWTFFISFNKNCYPYGLNNNINSLLDFKIGIVKIILYQIQNLQKHYENIHSQVHIRHSLKT